MLLVPSSWTYSSVWVVQLADTISEPVLELVSTNKQKSASPRINQTSKTMDTAGFIFPFVSCTFAIMLLGGGGLAFDGKDLGSAGQRGGALSATNLCDRGQEQAKHLPEATRIP